MKRLNYYQVHKNKSPKKLKNKNTNFLKAQLSLIAIQSFTQQAIIISQQFNSAFEKSLAIIENVKNHAEAVQNLYKTMQKTPYEYQQEAKNEVLKALEKAKELERIKQLKNKEETIKIKNN